MDKARRYSIIKRTSVAACACMLLLLPCSLFSQVKMEAPETPKMPKAPSFPEAKKGDAKSKALAELQAVYESLGDTVPSFCMLSETVASSVASEISMSVTNELVCQMVARGLAKPVTMNKWLKSSFGKRKAGSPFSLINAIGAEQYPVGLQGLCKTFVFRSDAFYCLIASFYPLSDSPYPITVLRLFRDDKEIPLAVSSCLDEYTIRARAKDSVKKKKIIVADFDMEFRKLIEIDSGEFDFVSVPFISQYGVTLKAGDDYFSHIMGYVLSTTNLAKVMHIGDFADYAEQKTTGEMDADYCVKGRVQVTDKVTVLYMDVIDPKTGNAVFSVHRPVREATLKNVWDAYREMSSLFLRRVYDAEKIGVVPLLTSTGKGFYANGMFIGWESVENLVLRKGVSEISTGSLLPMAKPGALSATPESADRIDGPSAGSFFVLIDTGVRVFKDREGEYVWNLLRK